MTPTMQQTAPPEIPGFRFVRLLGAGECADVYLYLWQDSRTEAAVRVWREPLTTAAHDALARETTQVAELAAHPHLVPLHAVGRTKDGRSFVVMDHLAGPDLEERRQAEKLGVEQALSVTIAVAGAVSAAARRGIVHGALRPEKILTTITGVPQLVGFGQHAAAGRPGLDPIALPWLPPEMLEDPPEPSVWVDVWGLAAICYALLAGRTPFEVVGGPNAPGDLVSRIKTHELPPTGRADVPESLEQTLRKAMSKRRAARYWSAEDFAKALQAVQRELGQVVTPIEDVPERPPEPERPAAEPAVVREIGVPEPRVPTVVAEAAPEPEEPTERTVPLAAVPKGPDGPPPPPPAPKKPAEDTVGPIRVHVPGDEPRRSESTEPRPAIYAVTFPTGEQPVATAQSVAPEPSEPSEQKAPEPAPAEEPEEVEPRTTKSAALVQTAPEPAAPQPVDEASPDTAETPVSIARAGRDDADEADLLGYRGDIDRLARLLASKETRAPLAVALQAPQGSGRSTVLTQLQERIDELGEQSPAYVGRVRHVRFNVLHHGGDRVVAGVLDDLRRCLAPESAEAPRKPERAHATDLLRAAQLRREELHAALEGVAEDSNGAGWTGRRKGAPGALTTSAALEAADREVAAREEALQQLPVWRQSATGRRDGTEDATVGAAYEQLRRMATSEAIGAGVDRVFLYVDDLDRCDPARAVGVLQAVELISRLDGFVVVAGLDSARLQEVLAGREPDPGAYLERIFQIPIVLRPLAGEAAVRYMRSLVGKPGLAGRARSAGRWSGRASELGDLELSDVEAVYVADLARFCGTPRGVEKLLNLYRMARTSPLATSDPESYRPLGVLVAMVVGAPEQALHVFDAVLDALATGGSRAPFADLLQKACGEHVATCELPGCTTRAAWRRVVAAYGHLCRVQDVPREIGAYGAWVEEVSRYVFAPVHGPERRDS